MMLPYIFVMMGMLEFCFMFFTWVAIEHGAQEGIRMAITGADADNYSPASNADRISSITDTVTAAMTGVPRLDPDLAVTVRSWGNAIFSGSTTADDPGRACYAVEVEVEYIYRPIVPMFQLISASVPMTTKQRAINEQFAACGQ